MKFLNMKWLIALSIILGSILGLAVMIMWYRDQASMQIDGKKLLVTVLCHLASQLQYWIDVIDGKENKTRLECQSDGGVTAIGENITRMCEEDYLSIGTRCVEDDCLPGMNATLLFRHAECVPDPSGLGRIVKCLPRHIKENRTFCTPLPRGYIEGPGGFFRFSTDLGTFPKGMRNCSQDLPPRSGLARLNFQDKNITDFLKKHLIPDTYYLFDLVQFVNGEITHTNGAIPSYPPLGGVTASLDGQTEPVMKVIYVQSDKILKVIDEYVYYRSRYICFILILAD